MREIKFRVYIKSLKKIEAVREISFGGKEILGIRVSSFITDSYITEMDYELMQYTGLKDKNGKEIYEGDILKDIKTEKISQIYWNGITASFKLKGEIGEDNELFDVHGSEIIGNIYENPELLNEQNR